MIKFNCDRCEMEIELEDQFAGTKYECFNCGDVNRVPQLPSEVSEAEDTHDSDLDLQDMTTHDRAAQAGYPPDDGPEVRVLRVRRCWFRSRPIRFSIAVTGVLLGLVGMLWVMIGDRTIWWQALFVPMTIFFVGLITWWWIQRFGTSLEISTKRTIMHRGFLSKSTSEVAHDNIRNIQIDQTFLQRLMRVGRIGISSSGQDGIELQVNHLKDPENELKRVIDLYRPL